MYFDFKSIMQQNRYHHISKAVLMKFQQRASMDVKKNLSFVFVEGSTDERFYSATNISRLKEGNAKYFFTTQRDYEVDEEKIVGKEAVLCMLKKIASESQFSTYYPRCIFIVDRDYEKDGIGNKGDFLSQEEKGKIGVTLGYSFENYFFLEKNLITLLKVITGSEEEYEKLNAKIMTFVSETEKYFSAKYTISKYYQSMGYRCVHNDSAIFGDCSTISGGYDKEKLNQEYQNMIKYIDSNRLFQDEYKKYKKLFQKDPMLFARGHNIWNFIVKYFAEEYAVQIEAKENPVLYRKIVNELKVDIYNWSIDNQ